MEIKASGVDITKDKKKIIIPTVVGRRNIRNCSGWEENVLVSLAESSGDGEGSNRHWRDGLLLGAMTRRLVNIIRTCGK